MRLASLLSIALAISCSKSATSSKVESKDAAVKPADETGVGTGLGAPSASSAALPTGKPLASVTGRELRRWTATQAIGAKRVQASALPDPVRDELATLGRTLGDGRRPRVRWVRAITPGGGGAAPTLAFSVGFADGENLDLLFAVALDDGHRYQVFDRVERPSRRGVETNRWGFGADRDVDGDGAADTVVTHQWSATGSEIASGSELVLLGSRGFAAHIELASAGGHEVKSAVVACWSSLDSRPALVVIHRTHDSLDENKPVTWSRQLHIADARGDVTLAPARLEQTNQRGVEAWRRIVGASAKPRFIREPLVEVPPCPGNGEAVLADDIIHRLK